MHNVESDSKNIPKSVSGMLNLVPLKASDGDIIDQNILFSISEHRLNELLYFRYGDDISLVYYNKKSDIWMCNELTIQDLDDVTPGDSLNKDIKVVDA